MKADFEKGTKICSKCKRELPISEFYKDKSRSDGLRSTCKDCTKNNVKEYRNTEKGKLNNKKRLHEWQDRNVNTFQRCKKKRGDGNFLKRDYELTKEQLERRNKSRKQRTGKYGCNIIPHGIMIWYDRKLDDLSKKEYKQLWNREYSRQRGCAIRGYIGRTKPSEHFLFDFDLEQMLKDNVYTQGRENNKRCNKYMTRWWKGTIRHWTVNDGIWKE